MEVRCDAGCERSWNEDDHATRRSFEGPFALPKRILPFSPHSLLLGHFLVLRLPRTILLPSFRIRFFQHHSHQRERISRCRRVRLSIFLSSTRCFSFRTRYSFVLLHQRERFGSSSSHQPKGCSSSRRSRQVARGCQGVDREGWNQGEGEGAEDGGEGGGGKEAGETGFVRVD